MSRTHANLSELDARVRAIEPLLVAEGHVDPAALDALIDACEHRVGPHRGAHVVARARTDPAFLDWLRRDATAAIASMGCDGRQGGHMVAAQRIPRGEPIRLPGSALTRAGLGDPQR